MKTRIVVSHDASEDAMGFCSVEEHEQYLFAESLENFEAMLTKAIRYQFPGAEITIDRGNRYNYGVWVNGESSSDDAGVVNSILADVFGGFEWLVKNPEGWK
jgi:hypothetical protein